MMKLMGLFTIIPATMLLAVSFFVMFVLRKVESEGLKVFGYAIAVLLWISAALVFSSGVTGSCPMMRMMHGKMSGMMGSMPGMAGVKSEGTLSGCKKGMGKEQMPAMQGQTVPSTK